MPYPKGKPKKDLTGQKFGRLSVIRQTDMRKHSQIAWECLCDCGNTTFVRSSALTTGNSTSCGCYTKERQFEAVALPCGEAEFNRIIRVYKRNAKKSGRKFALSKDQMRTLTKALCYYCGAEPFAVSSDKLSYGDYVYNGIDRVDSSGDYSIDNIVTCCKHCNVAKHDMTQAEFAQWLVSAFSYWGESPQFGATRIYKGGDLSEEQQQLMGKSYRVYKSGAKRFGRPFVLSKEEFYHITQMPCYYCGSEPSNVSMEHRTQARGYRENQIITYVYNGLDRIDATKGYTLDNIVPACKHCNVAKRAMSQQEFAGWLAQAYNYWAKDFIP